MIRRYGEVYGTPKSGSFDDRAQRGEPRTKDPDPAPPEEVVIEFHTNAPVDTRPTDIHHTLGPNNNQAAPGDHNHDGGNSRLLLEGYVLTGSKANPATVIPSILACLTRLGAQDSTT